MAGFVLPDRSVIVEPTVIEDATAPRFVADGAIVRVHPERVLILCYVAPVLSVGHQHAFTIDMTRTGYDRSFLCAAVRWEPMPGWPGYLTMH